MTNSNISIAELEAAELALEIELLSLSANDKARDRLALVLHDVMVWGDESLAIDALTSGLDIVISVNTGTFIASFARAGEALRYASTLAYNCTVIRADNCAEMVHHIPTFTDIVSV